MLKKIGGTGECAKEKGECTASEEWEISGAELGAGHHAIVIVVTDRAGNEARREESISVRHSTPVAVGPGSVDLESGDFSLGATDLSMGSGLTVSRVYSSRATEEGDEGPLGPEWSMSMGSTESLVEMVDGSLRMTSANGSQAIFAMPLAGVKCESGAPFESPPGDSNLKLWCEENKEAKKRIAYYLEDAADHTKVKFTLPSGDSTEWVPTVQEGAVATDTVTYKYQTAEGQNEYAVPAGSGPADITAGPNGNLWYTDFETSKIGEITTTGAVTEYALPTGSEPIGIMEGPDGNLWYADDGTSKIGEITTAGAVTEYALPTGSEPDGITEGPDGNLWYADDGTSKIGKITTAGAITEYALSGEANPSSIVVGPDGNLWYTDGYRKAIGKITTSGVVTEYVLPTEAAYGIAAGPDGDLWFTVDHRNAIGKITTSGVVTEYALPSGSAPTEMVEGPDGNLWYTNSSSSSKIGKITPSGVVSEYGLPATSKPQGITVGPDGNLWFTDLSTNKIGVIPSSGTISEPTEALAPVPAGVSCSWKEKPTEMSPGCRALEFKYATETTAKGEAETEWGEYDRRLMKVSMVAYNPAAGHEKMEEAPVAEYRYDKLGRLRAEWDPRLSTPLKTRYGYDAEGHVTALDPSGEEPWTFTYGTAKGDSGTGRLLKTTRAPTSAGLWGGETVRNSEAPTVTGSPIVGVRLAVSNGKWSGSPLTYGYQWEECNSGRSCTPILGADNANYTPVPNNAGHTLVALVSATNGGGSEATVSAATGAVAGTSVTRAVDSGNSINAVSCIPSTTDCVVSDSKGNAYYATNVSTSANATWTSWSGPSGESPSQAVDCPTTSLCLLADGKEAAGGAYIMRPRWVAPSAKLTFQSGA